MAPDEPLLLWNSGFDPATVRMRLSEAGTNVHGPLIHGGGVYSHTPTRFFRLNLRLEALKPREIRDAHWWMAVKTSESRLNF